MATYKGKATIVAVDGKELRWTDGLTEEQVANAMVIGLTVKPEDENFDTCEVEIEISERECKGKLAGKTQCEISLQQLHRQGLIARESIEDLETIFPSAVSSGAVGKTISVYQKETNKGDKVYVNTYLSSSNSISNNDIRARLARLRGLKAPSSSNPFD